MVTDPIKSPVGRFEMLCRERGIRVTAQRMAVYRALARDRSHPTADAIYARLRGGMSSLSQATVYRILEFLEKEGMVRKVSTTEGAARYDANLERHQHLGCRVCGRMTDFQMDPPAQLRLPREGTEGFVAEDFDIRIVGTCRQCRGAAQQPNAVEGFGE